MPRELITIQVGQCGNQIGCGFWELALAEYAQYSPDARFDDAMSCFFRNMDTTRSPAREIPVGDGRSKVSCLKARSIMVDMEEGVVDHIMRSPLGELFDGGCRLTDVSGSGNNWARGYNSYGDLYSAQLMDKSFLMFHSLGGGTGSGLGTRILRDLHDHHPELFRFAVSVFPSENDDVITSPYNTVLSLNQLIEHADCILPIENESLIRICNSIEGKMKSQSILSSSLINSLPVTKSLSKESFREMNLVAARVISNLTASMRYQGDLNIDLNEITTNLVPYPRMSFLLSSLAPLYSFKDLKLNQKSGKSMDQILHGALDKNNQLLSTDPRRGRILSCGLLYRGDFEISDLYRGVERMSSELNMIYWNNSGFKIGLCKQPPIGQSSSLLMLTNSCAIGSVLKNYTARFQKLFRPRLYLHHYTEFMPQEEIMAACDNVVEICNAYAKLNTEEPLPLPKRLVPQF